MERQAVKVKRTYYKRQVFRSRLEARWALFFDHIRVAWVYEPQGFVFADGEPYLPDFHLVFANGRSMYAEVKPAGADEADWRKARKLAREMSKRVLLCRGAPTLKSFVVCSQSGDEDARFCIGGLVRPDRFEPVDNEMYWLLGAVVAAEKARF